MRALLLLAVATVVACSDGDDGLSPESVVGTYQLDTVNDYALPAAWWGHGTTYISGTLEMRANGTYLQTERRQVFDPAQPFEGPIEDHEDRGTWQLSGTMITMQDSDGVPMRARMFGDRRLVVELCDVTGACGDALCDDTGACPEKRAYARE